MRSANLIDAIGNTPLVELPSYSPKRGVRIFAKLEGNNPTGSVKD
ncbi:MAG: pyridoxal-phosphate dependent enzyme, partial [Dehalococcoidia bacterium]